jgi:N-acetylglutamate synthase-like GNAT family acetyltransferase
MQTLRDWTPADLEPCLDVLRSNVPEYAAPHEVEDFRGYLGRFEREGVRYLVAEEDGAVVACGGLARAWPAGVATFCWGLVRRDRHGRGLGTRLALERLGWIVDDARFSVVALDTSQRTEGFFARFGFRTVHVTPDGYAPGLHRHDMELALDDAARARIRAMAR